ncbi:MAG: MlaD family protein, partial [Solirubrobacteraceae bacterium]
MKRILISAAVLVAVGAVLVISTGGSNSNSSANTYKIELDNAFGLVSGADFKVAGVRAGTIKSIDLDQRTLHAVVTVHVTQPGFGAFHSDAFCQSRPHSLIGEYFVECQPGTAGKVLTAGATIPVTHTQTTIPADLLQDVMRMPYRERFTLIINELGAAVAGRSSDLQAALQRAVPALTQTDNLLRLLGNDSQTLQALTANSDAVITALANNSAQVRRFIDEADKAATDTATQQSNLQASLHKLPGFLEQLRPALQKLGAATDANLPVVSNLNAASGQLNRLFTDLPAFSRSAVPALRSLGQASVTGKTAVQAANPTITHLNQFARSTPELSGNLAIVLHDLDDRSRAVEPDPRSPNGQGYTGLEAVLQYVFNQTLAINTFGPFGHQLTVDAFVSAMCTPYATPGTIAQNLQTFGSRYRSCYSWLGPNQPG